MHATVRNCSPICAKPLPHAQQASCSEHQRAQQTCILASHTTLCLAHAQHVSCSCGSEDTTLQAAKQQQPEDSSPSAHPPSMPPMPAASVTDSSAEWPSPSRRADARLQWSCRGAAGAAGDWHGETTAGAKLPAFSCLPLQLARCSCCVAAATTGRAERADVGVRCLDLMLRSEAVRERVATRQGDRAKLQRVEVVGMETPVRPEPGLWACCECILLCYGAIAPRPSTRCRRASLQIAHTAVWRSELVRTSSPG